MFKFIWLSRLCADKTTLYQTITGFQPSIGRHFVAFHTISTTDPEEPFIFLFLQQSYPSGYAFSKLSSESKFLSAL